MFRDLDDIVPSLGEMNWLELEDEVADVDDAARRNEILASRLGWNEHQGRILALLGLPASASAADLARAASTWQAAHGLETDGIIGPKTWAAMQDALGFVGYDSAALGAASDIEYPVKPGQEYGPRWKSTMPPGLPPNVRKTSTKEAALPHVERLAGSMGLGTSFVRVVVAIADHESDGRFARPADAFNGHTGPYAWGVFQFNRDVWRGIRKYIPDLKTNYPWEVSARDELLIPLRVYSLKWREVRDAGGDELAAARGLVLWHRSPTTFRKKYMKEGRARGFGAAWSMIQESTPQRVLDMFQDILSRASYARTSTTPLSSSNATSTSSGLFSGVPGVERPGGGPIKDKRDPQSKDLESVPGFNWREQRPMRVRVHRLAAAALRGLIASARQAGFQDPLFLPVSGYRDTATQQKLWEKALRRYGSPEKARKWVAPPGKSAHHSGRALDLWLGFAPSKKRVRDIQATPQWQWLRTNAQRFGFYPYKEEPWHWEYNPPAQGSGDAEGELGC